MSFENFIENMRSNFNTEGPLDVHARKNKLQILRDSILKNESLIYEALNIDLGKSQFESYVTEVKFVLDELDYTLKNLDKWTKKIKVGNPLTLFSGKSYIYPNPYGIVLVVSPWNYPFQLSLTPLIGAFAAGNRVILKPSEFAPQTAMIIKKLIKKVFTDLEVFCFEGEAEESKILLKNKFDYIFFTGSTRVGREVMKEAAENLTPVTLELGGKSPCLIDESANIDLAAKRCLWGKLINSGQTCVAPDFVLIPRFLQDQFIEKLRYYLNSFYGDISRSPDYSRIINTNHFLRLTSLIDPNKVVIGGQFREEDRFFPPTVMRDVSWDDKVMEDEIFGPILPIIPYDDLVEVKQKLMTLPRPLAFYLFSERSDAVNEFNSRISFGGGCVNDTVLHLANKNLPFGGIGTSGLGSYHGKKTFDTFTHYKSIFHQSTKFDIPLRYPPYRGKLKWFKIFL